MTALQCSWEDLLDEETKKHLNTYFYSAGLSTLILSTWLNWSIILSNLRKDESYWFLMTFTMTSWNRIAWTVMPWKSLSERTDGTCILYGFLDTIMSVAEVEFLTHICVERYVVTKYSLNGLPMPLRHYRLFKKLTVFFCLSYSLFPFIVGQYTFDFTCTSCNFDMILPDSWAKYIIVAVLFLRSVKPAAIMLLMLKWTNDLEYNVPYDKENTTRKSFTVTVNYMAIVNLLCWTPLALIRASVILSQLLYITLPLPSAYVIKGAMFLNWGAPGLTITCLIGMDPYIFRKMFGVDTPDYFNCEIEEDKDKEDE